MVVYAFYPSQVPHHYVSPVVEGATVGGDRREGAKIIAHFSRAREDAGRLTRSGFSATPRAR